MLEPTAVFRLVRASGGGRRSAQRQLTPLVGRGEEIAMLLRHWERARHGDGQLVLIVGEPGLGKSRLIEEFHRRVRDTPHTWVEWSCSQLLQNTPLHPITEWGRQRFRRRRRASGAAACGPGKYADTGQARSRRECPTSRADPRHSADPGPSNDSGAGGIAAPTIVGGNELGNRGRQSPAGGSGVGRPTLGRPDDA